MSIKTRSRSVFVVVAQFWLLVGSVLAQPTSQPVSATAQCVAETGPTGLSFTISGVAEDASGDLFLAEQNGHRVRKFSATGITTVAGTGCPGFSGDGGPAKEAQLSYATGIALDPSGNLYIIDEGNNRVRKVTPGGMITTIAGTGSSGYEGDGGPASAAQLSFVASPRSLLTSAGNEINVDAAGNLWISDSRSGMVREIFANGTITTALAIDAPAKVTVRISPQSQTTVHAPVATLKNPSPASPAAH